MLSILIAIALSLLLIKCAQWLWNYNVIARQLHLFPGAKGLPLIGHALEFKEPHDILPVALSYMKQYGMTFRVQLGTNQMLFTGDPRLNELITTSHTLMKKSLAIRFMKNWIGEGLITTDNPRWKLHRRLITPTFHFKILEDFVPIFNRNAAELVDFFRKQRMNKEFDVYEDILLCALDAICETAMGKSINALKDGAHSSYVESIKYMGKCMMSRTFSFWKQFDCLYNLTPEHKKEVEMLNYVKNIAESVIKSRQEVQYGGKDDLGRKRRVAFLDHLRASLKDNGGIMNDEQLREEVDTFIFAGHDTVASATSFALHFLSKHQDVQERAYEEVMHVLNGDVEMTYEKLADLKYLELVLKETLRLCPSVPLHSREMTEDLHFDGKIIPKGAHVVLFVYGSHRNPALFDQPEEFQPERFADEDFVKRTLFGYIPFNAGPRNCIGQKYAMTAMKCIIARLLREFKITKRAGFEIQPVAETVLKSSNGIRIILEKRK